MARGGFRPGAGRPRKTPVAATAKAGPDVQQVVSGDPGDAKTPLEYMLSVMNDISADEARRDRMAVAAAPFLHLKASEAALGKKEQKMLDAKEAAASGGKFAPPAAPKLVVSNK